MFNTIRNTLSQTIDGTTKWRDHVNAVFAQFSGNALSKRKADEFAAALVKLESSNQYWALSSTTPKVSVEAIEEKISQLCNRTHDNIYGDGYYDFMYPIFSAPYCSEYLEQDEDENDKDHMFYLMLATTVEFNEKDRRINIRQSIKVYDSYTCEFREAAISPDGHNNNEKLICNDLQDRHCFDAGEPTEEAIARLFEAPASKYKDVQGSYMYLLKNEEQGTAHHANKEHIYISLIRNIQTMEYDFIIDALGKFPKMDFTSASSHCALFDGNIDFNQYV